MPKKTKTFEETVVEEQPKKTEKPSELYYTALIHADALRINGLPTPKISPDMTDEELEKIMWEMHQQSL